MLERSQREKILWIKAGPDDDRSIKVINDNFKFSNNRQKSYTDNHSRALEFKIGDKIFLKLSPWKGVIRFGRKGNLIPR